MASPGVRIDAPPSLDGRVVLRLSGELDLSTADAARAALIAALGDGTTVVVDLSELAFIDVVGMRALLAAHEAAVARGSCLLLRSPQRCVTRVAALMELGFLRFSEDGWSDGGAGPPLGGRTEAQH